MPDSLFFAIAFIAVAVPVVTLVSVSSIVRKAEETRKQDMDIIERWVKLVESHGKVAQETCERMSMRMDEFIEAKPDAQGALPEDVELNQAILAAKAVDDYRHYNMFERKKRAVNNG